jgi:hypothetical protein
MLLCASMSKQSDGDKKSKKHSDNKKRQPIKRNDINKITFVIGDCEVECILRQFQPNPRNYSDYTDWNYDCT